MNTVQSFDTWRGPLTQLKIRSRRWSVEDIELFLTEITSSLSTAGGCDTHASLLRKRNFLDCELGRRKVTAKGLTECLEDIAATIECYPDECTESKFLRRILHEVNSVLKNPIHIHEAGVR